MRDTEYGILSTTLTVGVTNVLSDNVQLNVVAAPSVKDDGTTGVTTRVAVADDVRATCWTLNVTNELDTGKANRFAAAASTATVHSSALLVVKNSRVSLHANDAERSGNTVHDTDDMLPSYCRSSVLFDRSEHTNAACTLDCCTGVRVTFVVVLPAGIVSVVEPAPKSGGLVHTSTRPLPCGALFVDTVRVTGNCP